MKQGIFTIIDNHPLTDSVYQMTFSGDVSAITAPGQFINIKIPGFSLRRPISVYDCNQAESTVTIIYKVVGHGTDAMRIMPAGTSLDVLTGLGNGYDTGLSGQNPVLLGGGVGVPPLYYLAKQLLLQGKSPRIVLGFNTAAEIFCEDAFKALSVPVAVTTVDGSYGIKGFVTDALSLAPYSYFYTCGPKPMLKAVNRVATTSGQFSFEERMGCGFGACMGCSIHVQGGGYKRVCKDGPVFLKEEIVWED